MVLEYDKNDRLYKRTIYFVETFTLPIFHLFPLSPKQEEWLLLSKMKSKVDGIFIIMLRILLVMFTCYYNCPKAWKTKIQHSMRIYLQSYPEQIFVVGTSYRKKSSECVQSTTVIASLSGSVLVLLTTNIIFIVLSTLPWLSLHMKWYILLWFFFAELTKRCFTWW